MFPFSSIHKGLDGRLTKLEATNEEILGLLKVYDMVVYKAGSSPVVGHRDGPCPVTKDGQTQTTDQEGSLTKNNVPSTEQSQQTCELSIGPSSSARNKGKAPIDDCNLNVIVPDSDEEDDLFVNKNLSTPKVCTKMSISPPKSLG